MPDEEFCSLSLSLPIRPPSTGDNSHFRRFQPAPEANPKLHGSGLRGGNVALENDTKLFPESRGGCVSSQQKTLLPPILSAPPSAVCLEEDTASVN
ncbi:hypothetical protein PMG11_02820 [Penicillium brasilianum]|uniref:Uncharacterized protein n=1 Tax=Penicillium brasilianum TaxID=104259 RepID=A0A0F7TJ52_PENBI|nr:hypothetical protein PMG11_02820 [Penicillium brasilianum]